MDRILPHLTATDAAVLAAVAVALILVLVAAVVVLRRRRAPLAPPPPPPQELPPAQRRAPPPAPPPAPPEEAVLAREEREARRKEEYRRKKEEERLERERRREAQEEEARRAREEAERAAREADEARQREEEERRRRVEAEAGRTLAAGLEKTRGGFMARLNALFTGGKPVDESVLADLEEVLFTADIGVKTATQLLETARERVKRNELSDPSRLRAVLRQDVERILSLDGRGGMGEGLAVGAERPYVVMIVGVNGSGKTTTVGKLAAKLQQGGHTVLLGAGDTFRAAAGEQLEIWADRVGAPVVRGKEGSDPASVCFEAVKQGVERGVDVVLCDTAGRLHTKTPLMEELKKVKRVMSKATPGAPHEVLLVLDSTNGQNAIAQARQFHEALGVTGLVLTKLDGTAKGGVVIGICDELKLPVRYVGVGEKVADLRPFSPHEFVEALFEE
ncbi:MAG TPA: signal recognition particle-docking protein FtsY [Anaeromyxobacteraceae bacterium]|nr:signal recognition particle-docking protein FtsY [Anaeromyxobacteraceae bacterium]